MHMCVCVCVPASTSVQHVYTGTCRGLNKVADAQELELWVATSCYVCARNQTKVLYNSNKPLRHVSSPWIYIIYD